ncbi:hypothetical protein LY78DRAFT_658533 [Colletotrichum sublineola]|nr:hypothetical protein LY78DRAFT_658533 [Colletotrichum sublineola]
MPPVFIVFVGRGAEGGLVPPLEEFGSAEMVTLITPVGPSRAADAPGRRTGTDTTVLPHESQADRGGLPIISLRTPDVSTSARPTSVAGRGLIASPGMSTHVWESLIRDGNMNIGFVPPSMLRPVQGHAPSGVGNPPAI